MRIAHPCSEDLPNMPRTPGGVHCSRCDRDVVDLRRVPRKRALAVLAEKRASEGRVCAWVRASADGTPVFAADASLLTRFVAPAIVATALTACGASSMPRPETPIAFVEPTPATRTSGSTNALGTPVIATAIRTPPSPVRPASNVQQPVMLEMAGDMAF